MNFGLVKERIEQNSHRLPNLDFRINTVAYVDVIYTFVLKNFKGVRERLYTMRCEADGDRLRYVLIFTQTGKVINSAAFPVSDAETNIFNAVGYATSQILTHALDRWQEHEA